MATATELTINSSASALEMAETIFGSGIEVVSATYTGDPIASGIYSDAGTSIPGVTNSDSGVILSTGSVDIFTNPGPGTNTNLAAGSGLDNAGVDGDPDLFGVSGQNTFDAAILEAVFIPTGDYLTMQFVFTSEEYPEYINLNVNDSFGVWVNGQFVEATITVSGNIAIDSVNQNSNQNLYIDNTADQFNTEMDGFTYTLSFKAPVNPGQENTIKIGIADGGDAVYDSNVLIAANSVQTIALAFDDQVQVVAGATRTVDVLANDRDLQETGLTITHVMGQPISVGQTVTIGSGEQITLNADGTLTVTADSDIGSNVITYQIVDGNGNTDIGYLTIRTVAAPTVDGVVQGTAAGDLIDTSYLGDPDGDRVDNNDATGVYGTVGQDDYILAGLGNDTVLAGAGNDSVFADEGNDSVEGGAGNDLLSAGDGDDTVFGGAGNDVAYLGAGNDSFGTYGNDSEGDDSVYGGSGNDVIITGGANDYIDGGTGDDTLSGGIGSDTMLGGDGNDNFNISEDHEFDSIVGGENGTTDNDTVWFGNYLTPSGVNVLYTGNEAGTYSYFTTTANGTFAEIEGVGLTVYNDSLDASVTDSQNIVYAHAGDDTVIGGGGSDIVYGGLGNDLVETGAGEDQVDAGADNDTVLTGEGNDQIDGGAGADSLDGGLGADTISGGAGNDTITGGADEVGPSVAAPIYHVLSGTSETVTGTGGNADFTHSVASDTGAVQESSTVVELSLGGPETLTGYHVGNGSPANEVHSHNFSTDVSSVSLRIIDLNMVETLVFTVDGQPIDLNQAIGLGLVSFDPGTTSYFVDASGNLAAASDGPGPFVPATLTFNGPLSTLGVQNISSDGTGNGTLYEMSVDTNPATETVADESDSLSGDAGDDVIAGGSGADSLYGGDDRDTLTGTGDDVIDGGEGGEDRDMLVVDDVASITYGGGNNESGTVVFNDGTILTFQNIEEIIANGALHTPPDGVVHGTLLADTMGVGYVDAQGDIIDGADGDADTILADAGNDTVVAGSGNDLVDLGAGDDSMGGWSANDSGDDTISGGSGNDSVIAGSGHDSVFGGDGNDMLYGVSGNDTLIGDAGADRLFGGAGNDLVYGGAGNDILQVVDDYQGETLFGGTGTDSVQFSSYSSTLGVEVTFTGAGSGTFDYIGTASAGTFAEAESFGLTDYADTIDASLATGPLSLGGASGNDLMIGGAGADTIGGAADADTIHGGAGDVVSGGEGITTGTDNDTLVLNQADVQSITYGGGNNEAGTVTFYGGGTLTFSEIENIVYSGPVDGTAGDDVMHAGFTDLNGDQIDGSDGLNDTIYGYAGNDQITGGVGTDTIFGGTGNDTVDGQTGADALYGDAGNDMVQSYAGNDSLYGGAGNDYLVVDKNSGAVTVAGGENAGDQDSLWVISNEGLGATVTFTGDEAGTFAFGDGTASGSFTEIEKVNGTHRGDTIDASLTTTGKELWGEDGNDGIRGGSGADTIYAGADADTIFGAAGDVVHGGETTTAGGTDNDTLVLNQADVQSITYGGGNNEAGTVTFYGGGTLTFSEIENIVYSGPVDGTAGNDTMLAGYTDAQGDQIDGSDGDNDTVFGHGGNDWIEATAANDTVYGGTGNDTVYGGVGSNLLHGDEGDDFIWTDNSADTLSGLNDTLYGGIGNDTLYSRYGNDQVYGGTGDDIIHGGPGADTAYGGEGNDELNGGVDDAVDLFYGEAGNDLLRGDNGNDSLYGGADDDTVYGGANDDLIEGSTGNDALYGDAGNDNLTGGDGADLLQGGAGNDTQSGGAGVDDVGGGAGDDLLSGDAGADFIDGGDGNDTLTGGADADYMLGGADADVFYGGGSDAVDGGEAVTTGTDNDSLYVTGVLSVSFAPGNAENGTVTFADGSTLNFSNIENLYVDGVLTRPLDYVVEGTGGADIIDGSYVGDPEGDRVDAGDNQTGTNGDLIEAYGGNDSVIAGAGDDTVYAGSGDDTVYGGASNDLIVAGTGNDTVYGDEGNDSIDGSYGENQIYGGIGNDTILGGFDNDTIDGGADDDDIRGGGGANLIYGGAGNDIIQGGGQIGNGNDTIYAGTGNDNVYGDDGDDFVDLGEGDDRFGTYASDSVGNDTVYGGLGNDTIIGGDNDDQLTGGDGNDQIDGGLDNDSVWGDAGDDTLWGSAGNDRLEAGAGNDNLDGGTGNDLLYAGDGNDLAQGGTGEDSLYGDAGNDTLYGGADNDALSGGDNDDLAEGGDGNDLLNGDAGNDTLRGDAGNDRFYGGLGEDLIEGGDGDDLVSAEEGNDSVSAGIGNDMVWAGTGNDTVLGGAGDDVLLGEDGNDSLDGGDGADTIDAGVGNDTALGGAGADTINAMAGDDSVDGGAGNDSLFGWDGNDSLEGGDNDDMVDGDEGNDLVSGGAGNDTLVGDGGADTLTGGTGDDQLYAGTGDDSLNGGDGNDFFDGGDGNDSLTGGDGSDAMNAGAGNDMLDGGAGNDAFSAGDGDDTLYGGSGVDDLRAEGGNDLIYGGDGGERLLGGAGNDTLFGDAGNDSVVGGTGDDTLYGGAGVDTITGGDDRDLIVVDTGEGIGSTVDGNEGGDDYDTLDLRGWGRALTNVINDPGNPENGTVEFLDSNGAVIGTMNFSNIEHVIPCFTPGALIATDRGECRVEDLVEGDRVLTRDNGYQAIRWVGKRTLSLADVIARPEFAPVKIGRGSLGLNQPERDLIVSPQHRMLVAGSQAELLFGEHEVLVAAAHMTGRPGITALAPQEVTYIHLLFDQHEIIRANGSWTESFQPGELTLAGMEDGARREVLELFPELKLGFLFPAARLTVKKREANLLFSR